MTSKWYTPHQITCVSLVSSSNTCLYPGLLIKSPVLSIVYSSSHLCAPWPLHQSYIFSLVSSSDHLCVLSPHQIRCFFPSSPHKITWMFSGLPVKSHACFLVYSLNYMFFLGLLIKSHVFPSFLIACFFSGLSHRIMCLYLGIFIKSQVFPGFLIKSHRYSVVPHKIAYMYCSAWSPHQTTCLFPGLLNEPNVSFPWPPQINACSWPPYKPKSLFPDLVINSRLPLVSSLNLVLLINHMFNMFWLQH